MEGGQATTTSLHSATEEEFGHNEAGLNSLTEPYVVGDEEVDPGQDQSALRSGSN
jgi:hypothetical protein